MSSTSTISPPAPVLPAGRIFPRTGISTTIVHGLLSPMRDGALLAMDLIRPEAPGKYPVVLVRTPYDKTMGRTPFLRSLAERGYIVAIQDTRGRFNSDGVFFPYKDDRADGYDHGRVGRDASVVRRQDRDGREIVRRANAVVRRGRCAAALGVPRRSSWCR